LVYWYFDFLGVCVPGTACGTHITVQVIK
jgi:hypothetical protein